MAHIYRLIAFFFFLYPSLSFSQTVGTVDLAGWIKGSDGTYSKAYTNADGTSSRISMTSAPKGITTTSTALVQTSKGITAMDIAKTATVHTVRLGPAVVGLAKKAGPLGMAITAASLVCELSNICNLNGVWEKYTAPDPVTDLRSSTGWNVNGTNYPSLTLDQAIAAAHPTCTSGNDCKIANFSWNNGSLTMSFQKQKVSDNAVLCNCSATKLAAYVPSSSTHSPATDDDLNDAASKLNDDRFTPELIEKGESVPTDGVPTLTAGQKKGLGLDSVPTKDSSGNVTGREDTVTEIEAVDAGTTDKPGSVIIKETKTTIKYDNSNTQISSTTSTSYTNQPETNQPSGFTISFDDVPEATLPTYNVPNTFSSTSWGSGTCPPNIDIPITGMTIHLPTEPICDTAEMMNPFVLLLSSLIAIYIIAGVRGGSAS